MTVLSAQSIRKRGIFTPFSERAVAHGMTFGLGPSGYDVRIAESITLSASMYGPHPFALASTIEHFDVPADLVGLVMDKSSWARQGLSLFNTVIEPGWRGFLTLELSYLGLGQLHIEAGSPIAQIVFHKLDEETEIPYAGKYQDQAPGAQPAILEGSAQVPADA